MAGDNTDPIAAVTGNECVTIKVCTCPGFLKPVLNGKSRVPRPPATSLKWILLCCAAASPAWAADGEDVVFFEKKIRPILVKRCYQCHSEKAKEQEGGLLLDRRSGWLKGGNTEKAVLPGNPDASLLIRAIRYQDEALQMPPNKKLPAEGDRTAGTMGLARSSRSGR